MADTNNNKTVIDEKYLRKEMNVSFDYLYSFTFILTGAFFFCLFAFMMKPSENNDDLLYRLIAAAAVAIGLGVFGGLKNLIRTIKTDLIIRHKKYSLHKETVIDKIAENPDDNERFYRLITKDTEEKDGRSYIVSKKDGGSVDKGHSVYIITIGNRNIVRSTEKFTV